MPYLEANSNGLTGRFVQAFWQATGTDGTRASQRVLPDACADFIFDLGDPKRSTRDCATLVGTMTHAIVVPVQGARDMFGIRFRPGAAWLLWRPPMRTLCDEEAQLDDIVPGASHLADRLSGIRSFRERVALAEAWIEARLAFGDVDEEKWRTVAAINAHFEAGPRGAILSALDWNERKLQRFFEAAYGPSPATMRCFWRFEHLRRRLVSGPHVSLADLAIDHGFSDQAHMAREFQRFAGLSITAWQAEAALA